jgi:hypothetical protein
MSLHRLLTGRDLHEPTNVHVQNNSGVAIPKLKCVIWNGTSNSLPAARAYTAVTDDVVWGVAIDDIASGSDGFVCCYGMAYNIDTSAWAPGTTLYPTNTGDLSSVQNGLNLAVVVAQDAVNGALWISSSGIDVNDFTAVLNADAWSTSGNTGLANAKFFGTKDLQSIRIRTNNLPIASFDTNGRFGLGADAPLAHFYQKSGPGYTGSGIRQESLAMTTSDGAFTNIWFLTLSSPQIARITVDVMGRQNDGAERCLFRRTGLFYKEGGNVQIQGPTWSSNDSFSSSSVFEIAYTMTINDVNIMVKNSSGIGTYWAGKVEYQVLSTNV